MIQLQSGFSHRLLERQCYMTASSSSMPEDDTESKDPGGVTVEVKMNNWQNEGYPSFTRWMASSRDFCVLRRFDRLNTWVQLDWQDEIVQLEAELEAVNEQCRNNVGADARSDSLRADIDPMPRRQEIVKQLRPLLKDYRCAFEVWPPYECVC